MKDLDIKKLATLVARAPMSEKEKQAWIEALPFISKSDLAKLQAVLETEDQKLGAIREKYLLKAKRIVEKS